MLVPDIIVLTPCARRPISLDAPCIQLRALSPNFSLLYSCDLPVFGKITALSVDYASGGNDGSCFTPVGCFGGGEVRYILMWFAE